MIYNPFQKLGIQPTNNIEVINDAYKNLNLLILSANELHKLNLARQDCLFYAEADGDLTFFCDLHYN